MNQKGISAIIIILIIVGVLVVAGGIYWLQKDHIGKLIAKELPNNWRVCNVDSDCVETQLSCCNCNNGGIQTGINKRYLDDWKATLLANCRDIGCITLYNCKEGKTACQNNKCEFVQQADETVNWQTYRNEEYGFELKYPNNWFIEEGTGIIPIIRIRSWKRKPNENSDPYRDIEIIVLPGLRDGEKLGEFVQREISSLEAVEMTEYIGNLTIGNEKALDYLISPSNSEDKYRNIFVSKENKVYEFDIYQKNSDMEIFNQILSTFKFISQ